jgi:hypothetical protein
MRAILRRFLKSDKASVMPIVALMLPTIMGFAGLGVDVSNWEMSTRKLQTQTDAAVLAAASDLANGRSQGLATSASLREARNNGFNDTAGVGTLTTTYATDNATGGTVVTVVATQKMDLWFSSMFLTQPVYADTTAKALVSNDGAYCFLGLNRTGSRTINVSGTVTINAVGCGIAENSTDNSALYMNGNDFVNVGKVHLAGNYQTVGNVTFDYTSMNVNSTQTTDPYASLGINAFTGCTRNEQRAGPTRISGNTTLSPGVFCGGINISGNNTITLNPGTYIMDGGDFSASGGGSITGDGVTIILTNSGGSSYGSYGTFNVSGSKNEYFKAPTSGPYAGIAVYQDRNAPTSNGNGLTLTGSAQVQLDGVIYAPSNSVDYGGTSGVTNTTCSKIIADTINFHGTPMLGNDCTGKSTNPIGASTIRLVL